jgi:hypothetical protein
MAANKEATMSEDHWLDDVLASALLMENPYSVAAALAFSDALMHAIAQDIDSARQHAPADDRDETAKAIRPALIEAFNDPRVVQPGKPGSGYAERPVGLKGSRRLRHASEGRTRGLGWPRPPLAGRCLRPYNRTLRCPSWLTGLFRFLDSWSHRQAGAGGMRIL